VPTLLPARHRSVTARTTRLIAVGLVGLVWVSLAGYYNFTSETTARPPSPPEVYITDSAGILG